MGQWVEVCRASELPPAGEGRTYRRGELNVAIFRLDDGSLQAIDDECPHAFGSLGEGMLLDTIVVCPLHGWSFDVRTGAPDRGSHVPVKTYQLAQQGEEVQILVEQSQSGERRTDG